MITRYNSLSNDFYLFQKKECKQFLPNNNNMKNLKLMMITLILCFINIISYGQILKNNVFYTTFESGIGEKIQMEFQIKPFDLAKIQKTPIYINWIIQHPNNNNIKAFLNDKLQMASLKAKSRLRYKASYIPINGNPRIFCVNDEIKILFPMKAQNSSGNFMFHEASYTIKWINNKEETSCFIR